MPNTQQAIKRLRQNKARNGRNREAKSAIKTFVKKVLKAIEENDATQAKEFLRITQAKLDKAAKKGVMHQNTVNRRKSLLGRKVAAMQ